MKRQPRGSVHQVTTWSEEHAERLTGLGLGDLAGRADQLAACWPLHPLALAALPELCHRYGQNERTMFSFLASNEPHSVTRFLLETDLVTGGPLPVVGLDGLYDYFVESAATMVGVSADASRWLEIDTRIRDSRGLGQDGLKALKVIGLLNLISTGGALRASREMLAYALADGQASDVGARAAQELLSELEAAGLITYRDFADEFRVWQGTDFDLKGALEMSRRRFRDERADAVMRRAMELTPAVAAKHADESGTLRMFERVWRSSGDDSPLALGVDDRADGLVVYVLGDTPPVSGVSPRRDSKPVLLVTSSQSESLVNTARELLALDDVLTTDEAVRADWVARRELTERRVASAGTLEAAFVNAFGADEATYHWAKPSGRKGFVWLSEHAPSLSTVVSRVATAYYSKALPFKNELINRHELTSQAAKARREVADRSAQPAGSEQTRHPRKWPRRDPIPLAL